MTNRYGNLFKLDDITKEASVECLPRLPLKPEKGASKYDEAWLQTLIATQPNVLPIEEIEPVLADAIPICTEMPVKSGWVDLLLATPLGDLVIVECKLWRNPQARREVVGQILDYAKDIARLSYQEFEAAVLKATPAPGAAEDQSLYARASGEHPARDEHIFIDAVSRNLRRGRFLLLLVGDGIHEGVETMTEFLQQHAGLHFTLGLVEMAVFQGEGKSVFVQPRILARTTMIQRGVVAFVDDKIAIGAPDQLTAAATIPATPTTLSDERAFELLDQSLPGTAVPLKKFADSLTPLGITLRATAQYLIFEYMLAGSVINLGYLGVLTGRFGVSDTVIQAQKQGYHELGLNYYKALVGLIKDASLRAQRLAPNTKSGTAELPLTDLLNEPAAWRQAMADFLAGLPKNAEVVKGEDASADDTYVDDGKEDPERPIRLDRFTWEPGDLEVLTPATPVPSDDDK